MNINPCNSDSLMDVYKDHATKWLNINLFVFLFSNATLTHLFLIMALTMVMVYQRESRFLTQI